MKLSKYGKFAGVALAGALALSACGGDPEPAGGGSASPAALPEGVECAPGTLNAGGATSQELAMNAWRSAYQSACPDATVNYDPTGSGAGRTNFADGAIALAGSDAVMDAEEQAAADERCGGQAVHLPLYISPIAVIFNLEGVDELNLSPEVIAGIFNQEITNWNDEAIAADNPDAELPDLEITPVNRSDESGTTENFVAYLSAVAPDAWPHEVSGDWPSELSSQSGQGSAGVVTTVQGGNGTIGYVDASQVAANDLSSARVGVGEEFVEFSPEAAAAIVDSSPAAEGVAEGDLAIELDYTTEEAGVYPIVLISYEIICTSYENAEEGALVQSFVSYLASEDGQQVAATEAGSAPISETTRENVMAVLEGLGA
ncbi:phosphate ABC transporter substrate-binding protein PstS [Allonocardiopsis opalescens]|uniref:Phosphate-binding protein n=1 Tax=Allonocardiopsis opalescens TaxID=1144618 RepID=A0A2T0QA49_9ACTN|nr:phosphate ABC transporter substrate-binding protein PstS [Allonocardiopsis opalescens]PRY00786.1 phosphate ABC transporter substrate-binding protein (PhoT family) [Allonocardiopsis opalescens]